MIIYKNDYLEISYCGPYGEEVKKEFLDRYIKDNEYEWEHTTYKDYETFPYIPLDFLSEGLQSKIVAFHLKKSLRSKEDLKGFLENCSQDWYDTNAFGENVFGALLDISCMTIKELEPPKTETLTSSIIDDDTLQGVMACVETALQEKYGKKPEDFIISFEINVEDIDW